jgi:serine/threonine-protein kinase
MGEVFLASDERLGRGVAIKRIRHDAPPGAEARERLRREARAVARLNHPAIVQVYDILEAGGCDWIVLEYVAGDSLAELMVVGGLGVARALDVARQVAEGLAHAHSRGILHRDLKAENVRVTPDGRAKILDLGLAKLFDARAAGEGEEDGSLTRQGTIVGTPRAMAPEQAAGGPVDSRADLFSFGVLLYELLGGRSPFQAPSAAATLRRILGERPAPLRDLRPELPEELSDLVADLLAPEPADRPAGAAEVAGRLAKLAALPEIATLGAPGPLASSPRLSEAPTSGSAPRPVVPHLHAPASPPGRKPGEASGDSAFEGRRAGRRQRLRVLLATAALALGAAAVALLALRLHRAPPPVLVAVLEPSVQWSGDGGSQEGAVDAAVHAALLDTLASLRDLIPLDPSEVEAAPPAPAAAARATGADEVLRSVVTCDAGECQIVLHRLDGGSGRILATSRPFPVSAQAEDRLALADAVGVQLRRQLYPEHHLREGVPDLDVRDEDYAAYVELRRRFERGEMHRPEDLKLLSLVLETSPRFLEGQLLAARAARTLGRLDEAEQYALAAEGLAPEDPRPVAERFDVAIARGHFDDAEAHLIELERRAPGDPRVERARVRLLVARGRLGEAVSTARELVARRASWRNLWDLAHAQMLANEREPARRTLDELLRISPGNRWGLTKRAELDIFCDRLEAAADTYRELLAAKTLPNSLRNLGWVEYLLGRYDEAVEADRRALDFDPGHGRTRLNLALALEARGQRESAAVVYQELVAETGAADETMDATSGLLRAQSQVRLGMPREAVRTIREVLSGIPEPDAQVLYMAAQVFSLAGERLSALDAAERALEGGIGVRWFAVPAFKALAGDPEFRALLAGHRGRCG